MCGIAGIINFNGRPVEKRDLEKMTGVIRHRGPDDSGFFVRGNIGFGHRRLSIVDLSSAGHQPMDNEDGSIWITFNGEIFNYVELRNDLKGRGHVFKSDTDTEVIIHAYEEWGEEGFKNFNGDWAFAIADLKKGKIVLSRDRFSVKPLYYFLSAGTLYFSSEEKQLLPFLKTVDINRDVLFTYLKQGLIDFSDATFYKDIRMVKPKHNMVIDLNTGSIKEFRYWDFSRKPASATDEELCEKFKHLLTDSVRIRLRSDVPVGVLLSGGLDSSSISVIAKDLGKDAIRFFSVISSDKKYSEERFIDILNGKKNLKVKKFLLETPSLWNNLLETTEHYDEPFGGISTVAHKKIVEAIKKETDIKILLSGQGGDEILCGYKKFFFFYLRNELKKGHLLNVSTNLIFSLWNRTILWQFSLSEAKRYMPFFQRHSDPIDKVLKLKGTLEPLWEARDLKQRQIADIDKYSVPVLAHYEDRNSMRSSSEIRLPFLDYRLVDFVLNLPEGLIIRYGWSKYILRKTVTELPKEISWRKDKQGFLNPEEKWLKSEAKEKITGLFAKSALDEVGIIDKKGFLAMYDSFLTGDRKIWYSDIARFLIAELWMRKIARTRA